ncbi:hypothetical protein LTR70_007343 [Exophiala xenobiotica]|nr:hypothetical protein LTR70_007343 [Exophiala xenobiotica]
MSQKRSRREYEADLRKQEAPFVVYGTPLPPLDYNARDDGSYMPVWKQEVTDDRGRKRLHGAFTGGFSAGSNRAKAVQNSRQQRAEDFMDEEDLEEQEETRQISTTDGFAGFGTAEDPGARDMLDDLFKPTEDTMGEKLLNKMGWKKGQGIGPRTRRSVDPRDENSEVREFPPEDSPMLAFSHKNDMRGLGFGNDDGNLPTAPFGAMAKHVAERQDSTDDDDGRPGLSFMARPKTKLNPSTRSGIGVGSLNDTGSDEEDPYEMGPKVSYNRVMGGDKKKEKKIKASSTTANPLLKTKPVFISKSKQLPSILTSLRKCHDGKLPLTGFVLADELDSFSAMSLSDDRYKPPEVPDDWQPSELPQESDGARQGPLPTTAERAAQQTQTADSRRAALGEQPLPGKSVFDYLSSAARTRLATATGNQTLPPALDERPPYPTTTTSSSSNLHQPTPITPHLDPTTALTALNRLRKHKSPPYADDLSKQGRYKDFLRYSSEPASTQRIPPLRAPHHKFNDDAHTAELAEFVATADLFKPATGFLASRFTSASASPATTRTASGADPIDGGEVDREAETGTADLLSRPHAKPSDPAEEAARMGMFGIATRTSKSWMPSRLVCKRFGVEIPVSWNEE